MKKRTWKIVAVALAVLLAPWTASAVPVRSCAPCDPCSAVCTTKRSKLKVGGWLEASYYRNAWGQENSYVYDANLNRNIIIDGNGPVLGNFRNADFQVNQAWLYVEREMDTTHGFDWGFRADAAVGTNLDFAQAFNDQTMDWNAGQGDYYWGMPKLYATVGYKNLSAKIGKFPTLLGYESYEAPGKFFVSHSYLYGAEPLSTVGILGELNLGDIITLYGGWSMGNDTWENRFGDSQIIGGIAVALTEKMNLSYYFNYGYEYDGLYKNGFNRINYGPFFEWGSDRMDNYFQTVTLDWQLTKRLNYAITSNYFQSEYTNGYQGDSGYGKSYGIANYLTYQLNDRWALGFRAEWFRNEGRTGTGWNDFGGDFYEYTLGLKWTPLEHLTLLGEVRYDQAWQDGGGAAHVFNADQCGEQVSGGISAIVHF